MLDPHSIEQTLQAMLQVTIGPKQIVNLGIMDILQEEPVNCAKVQVSPHHKF